MRLAEYMMTERDKCVVLVTNYGWLSTMEDLKSEIGIGNYFSPYGNCLYSKSTGSRTYMYDSSTVLKKARGFTIDVLLLAEEITKEQHDHLYDYLWCAVKAGGTIATFRRSEDE